MSRFSGVRRRGLVREAGRSFVSVLLSIACVVSQTPFVAHAEEPIARPPRIVREIQDKRTERTRTYLLDNGQLRTDFSFTPTNYFDEETGAFERIDSTLEATKSARGTVRYENRADAVDISLPSGISTGWASVEATCGDKVSFRPLKGKTTDTASPRSSIGALDSNDDRLLEYRSAFDVADVEYQSMPGKLKETIVLKSWQGKNAFSYELNCPDLTPEVQSDGSIAFLRSDETTSELSIAAGVMFDSLQNSGDEPAMSHDVAYEVAKMGSGWRLDVTADAEWLQAPERVYPVMIDPTVITDYGRDDRMAHDAYVTDAFPSSNYGSDNILKVGYWPGSGNNFTYLRPGQAYDWEDFLDARRAHGDFITGASLKMWCYWTSTNGTVNDVRVYPVTGTWLESSITYNNRPGNGSSTGSTNVKYDASNEWDVTSIVRDWVEAGAGYYGFRIRTATTGNSNDWCKFWSDEESGAGPILTVTYTTPPDAPVVTAPLPDTSAHGDVRLAWDYKDEFGKKQTKYEFELSNSNGAVVWTSAQVSSAASETTIPSSSLPDGRYFLRGRVAAKGSDDRTFWSTWSPYRAIVLAAPQALSDHAGPESSRAAVDLGSGASVDLATGKLRVTRQDLSGPALGGALSVGAAYATGQLPSTSTALGRSWRLSVPTLTVDPSIVGDPCSVSGGWSLVDGTTRTTVDDEAKLNFTAATLSTKPQAYSSVAGTAGVDVSPGQRLVATTRLQTLSLTPSSDTSLDRGVVLVFDFYDHAGAFVSKALSVPFDASSTTTTLTLAADVPEGAFNARLRIFMSNVTGTAYVDRVGVSGGGLRITDAGGTARAFAMANGRDLSRDPQMGAGLSRENSLLKSEITASGDHLITGGSVDGGVGDVSVYDRVACSTGGTNYLQYDMKNPRIVNALDLFLYEATERPARSYQYRLTASEDGTNWQTVVADTWGRGWMHHEFTPVRARYVRVIALANQNMDNSRFHVVEIEAPSLWLGDSQLVTSGGQVVGAADRSANLIRYRYDSQGRLDRLSDLAGRTLDLTWSGSSLAGLSYAGIGSDGQSGDPITVQYSSTATTLTVQRAAAGTSAVLAQYGYDTSNRIAEIVDGDGVQLTIGYDGSGRVASATAGAKTVTIAYGTNEAVITAAGGGNSVRSRVGWSVEARYQPILTAVGPAGSENVVEHSYDEYGHVKEQTDATGGKHTYVADPHGNVLRTDEHGARTTRAAYDRDHLVSAWDPKGNPSSTKYDELWRPASMETAIADETTEGVSVDRQTYDTHGNLLVRHAPASTSWNLLKYGTIESDPLVHDWTSDGGSVVYDGSGSDGESGLDGLMRIGTGGRLISPLVNITSTKVYSLSAKLRGSGMVVVNEYDSSSDYIPGSKKVIIRSTAASGLRNLTGTYVPGAGAKKVKVLVQAAGTSELLADDIRLDLADTAPNPNDVENESFELMQAADDDPTLPMRWSTYTAGTSPDIGVSELRIMAGTRSAYIKHSTTSDDARYESAAIPMQAGKRYSASVSMKLIDCAGGATARVALFADGSCTQLVDQKWLTPSSGIKGTADWQRYATSFVVPSGAVAAKIYLAHKEATPKQTAYAYFDAVTLEPAVDSDSYDYDDSATFQTSATKGGLTTSTRYNAAGQVTETSVSAGGSAVRAFENKYDALGRLTTSTAAPDSADKSTASYSYTPGGRLASATGPRGGRTTYSYDANGQLSGQRSPEDWRGALRYDTLGRLYETMRPAAGVEPTAVASRLYYDSFGRVATQTAYAPDGTSSTTTMEYDQRGNILHTQVGGSGSIYTVGLNYDALDRVTTTTANSPAGLASIVTTYDACDLATRTDYAFTFNGGGSLSGWIQNVFSKAGHWVSSAQGGTTWYFTKNLDGVLVAAESKRGARHASFDASQRLVGLDLSKARPDTSSLGELDPFASITAQYDWRSRITDIQTSVNGTSAPAVTSDHYEYDALGRLAAWERTGASAADATYDYDRSGNLTERTDAGGTKTFDYDADDKLVSSETSVVTTEYQYDAFGRTTRYIERTEAATSTTAFTWNAAGQLSTMGSQVSTATYVYGADGMRSSKTVQSGGLSAVTQSMWYQGRLMAERASDGTVMQFLYAPDGTPLQLLVNEPSTATTQCYAYQVDAGGSVIALTDSTGTVVASYAYDPWGMPLSAGTSATNARVFAQPLRYRNYYYDAESGLYYMPARYYDPTTARFLSPDPAPARAGDPASLNRYAYCLDNPVTFDDPSGEILPEFYRDDERRTIINWHRKKHGDDGEPELAKARLAWGGSGGMKHASEEAKKAMMAAATRQMNARRTRTEAFRRSLLPSMPDDEDNAVMAAELITDVLLVTPVFAVGLVLGAVIPVAYTAARTHPLYAQGERTRGDLWAGYSGVVPLWGSAESLVIIAWEVEERCFGLDSPLLDPN